MTVSCSFKAIVSSPCSHDRRDQSKSVNEVPLLSCEKDIESHKSLRSFPAVTGARARTHSSKSGYFHYATGYKQSNYLSLSSV